MNDKDDKSKNKNENGPDHDFSITRFDKPETDISIAMQYDIGSTKIIITKDGRYFAIPPEISKDAENIFKKLMNNIFESLPPQVETNEKIEVVSRHLENEAVQTNDIDVWQKEKAIIEYYLTRDLVGYGIIDVLMNDPYIEDIICSREGRSIGIIHKKFSEYVMLQTNIQFATSQQLDDFIMIVSRRLKKPPTTSSPIVYSSTSSNDRITIIWKDKVSPLGSSFAIRKFPTEPYTITHLIESGVISVDIAAYLWMLIDATPFLLVIGETGSGKTTAINALMCLSNPRMHIIVLEDTRELMIPHYWVEYNTTFEDQHARQKNNHDITYMDLIRSALRRKPHFMIVGEVRGEETREMFQGATTGHGTLSSFHASGAPEALARLKSDPINITDNQLMNLWGILHLSKIRTIKGKNARRMMSYSEIYIDENNENSDGGKNSSSSSSNVRVQEVFGYDSKHDSFTPEKLEDVISLSKNKNRMIRRLGIENIATEFLKRKALLNKCVKQKAYTIKEVQKIISKCYSGSALTNDIGSHSNDNGNDKNENNNNIYS